MGLSRDVALLAGRRLKTFFVMSIIAYLNTCFRLLRWPQLHTDPRSRFSGGWGAAAGGNNQFNHAAFVMTQINTLMKHLRCDFINDHARTTKHKTGKAEKCCFKRTPINFTFPCRTAIRKFENLLSVPLRNVEHGNVSNRSTSTSVHEFWIKTNHFRLQRW